MTDRSPFHREDLSKYENRVNWALFGCLAIPKLKIRLLECLGLDPEVVIRGSLAASDDVPEDCGGIPGYYEFLNDIASKQTKKRKAALDWYGGPYDPDEIGEQQINTTLSRIADRSRWQA